MANVDDDTELLPTAQKAVYYKMDSEVRADFINEKDAVSVRHGESEKDAFDGACGDEEITPVRFKIANQSRVVRTHEFSESESGVSDPQPDDEDDSDDEETKQLKKEIARLDKVKWALKKKKEKDRLKAQLEQSRKEVAQLQKEGIKQTLLLCDDIPEHVTGVNGMEVESFPGQTLDGLAKEISNNKGLQGKIETSDMVIVHAGTNDIKTLHFEDFLAAVNNLFGVIHLIKPTVKLCYSAILPRPVDFKDKKILVIRANNRMRRFCKYRKIAFLQTFRPFVQRNGELHY